MRDGLARRNGANLYREIELRLPVPVLLRPIQRAGGDFRGDRHVSLLIAQPEHSRFNRDRKLDHGIFGIYRVGELLRAIFLFQMLKIARRVVAIAIAHMRARHVDLHMNRSPAAVALHFRAQIVANQIVPAVVLLDFRKRVAQIAQIKKRFSAGIRGKRGERVARIFALVRLMKYRGAREHRSSAGRVGGHVAARRRGQQTARIDRVNRYVGAIRRVGGGAQLRTVFFAGLRNPAGKFDHRLSSGNSTEHVGQSFHRRQLLVRIENVEFGFIGSVRRAGVFLHVVFAVLAPRHKADSKYRTRWFRSVARSLSPAPCDRS